MKKNKKGKNPRGQEVRNETEWVNGVVYAKRERKMLYVMINYHEKIKLN